MSVHYNTLVFRAPRNFAELRQLFSLRYRGYLESKCSSLVQTNELGYEIEAYDWQSLHMGLFREGRKKSHPIAYARVVQKKMGPHSRLVSQLMAQTPGLEVKIPDHGSYHLPIQSSCNDQEAVAQILSSEKSAGREIVEASRLVFAPEARQGGYAPMFVEAAMAATFTLTDADVIALACHPRHAAFYIRYGFKLVVDGRKNDYNGLQASIILLQKDGIHPARVGKINQLSKILDRGKIIYMPSNAEHQKATKRALVTA
jgi:predicted GNAT family N-acyltransferase